MPKKTLVLLAPDYAKAFGITLVVLGHVLRGLMTSGVVVADAFWVDVDRIFYLPDSVGFFHMPLFFYVSGLFFIDNYKRDGYAGIMKKAAFALICPLIVWSYLQFSVQYFSGGHANTKIDFFDVLTAPFPPRQQFWFLSTLFLSMALAGAVACFRKATGLFWGSLIACFLFRAIFPQYVHDGLNSNYNPLVQVLIFFPYFALGIVFGKDPMKKFKVASWLCVALFATAVWLNLQPHFQFSAIVVASSIMCVLALYKFFTNLEVHSVRQSRLSKFFVFVGMNSMMIYLAHVICAGGIRAIFLKFGIIEITTQIIGGVLAGLLMPLLLVPVGVRGQSRGLGFLKIVLPVRLKRK